MLAKKRMFPKIKKKLKWFLTDESWKISKKSALWLSAWAFLLAWSDIVNAWYPSCSTSVWHSSWTVNWHYSWQTSWTSTPHCNNNGSWHWSGLACNVSVNHSSWLVNWHFSQVPSYTVSWPWWHCNHGNHSSHSSSGTGCDSGSDSGSDSGGDSGY